MLEIISLVVTLLSMAVAFYQMQLSTTGYIHPDERQKQALNGIWKGKYLQNNILEGEKLSGDITIQFKRRGKRVSADVEVISKHFKTNLLYMSGGFKEAGYLSLDYYSKNKKFTQFGYMILHLRSNGRELSGKAMGYGPETEQIVTVDLQVSLIDT